MFQVLAADLASLKHKRSSSFSLSFIGLFCCHIINDCLSCIFGKILSRPFNLVKIQSIWALMAMAGIVLIRYFPSRGNIHTNELFIFFFFTPKMENPGTTRVLLFRIYFYRESSGNNYLSAISDHNMPERENYFHFRVARREGKRSDLVQ